jgi:hypothetical protein
MKKYWCNLLWFLAGMWYALWLLEGLYIFYPQVLKLLLQMGSNGKYFL